MVAGAPAGVIARVIAIEARALEHDADGVEQLAQTALALRAFGQRVLGEGLDDLKAVFARGTRVAVSRHGSSGWHSQGLTAKCTAGHRLVHWTAGRHGPEPFAKPPIMSVTNHVPVGPIESLAL